MLRLLGWMILYTVCCVFVCFLFLLIKNEKKKKQVSHLP